MSGLERESSPSVTIQSGLFMVCGVAHSAGLLTVSGSVFLVAGSYKIYCIVTHMLVLEVPLYS